MSVHTETRHIESRKPGIRQEKEITTTTVVDPSVVKGKSYAEAAGAPHHTSASHSSKGGRRASFSEKAQQLIPNVNVSKQQLAYGLPVVLAILLSLLFLGFRSSSFFQPPPPPTLTQQFANKLDSFGSNLGGDYWESLKHKTSALHTSASELADSIISHPGLESLKAKAEDLKAEADKQYKAANDKAAEYAANAKKAGAAGAAKVNAKVDGVKEKGADAAHRASLHGSGVVEEVRHAVNEATEAVRHTAAETSEAVRHKAAEIQNAAQHKAQDVKDTYHNIKDTIKSKVGL